MTTSDAHLPQGTRSWIPCFRVRSEKNEQDDTFDAQMPEGVRSWIPGMPHQPRIYFCVFVFFCQNCRRSSRPRSGRSTRWEATSWIRAVSLSNTSRPSYKPASSASRRFLRSSYDSGLAMHSPSILERYSSTASSSSFVLSL